MDGWTDIETHFIRSTRRSRPSKNKVKKNEKIKKSILRNRTGDVSHVRSDHSRSRSATRVCMLVIPTTYSEFHRNPFRGFGASGVEICHGPLYFACWLLQQLVLPYKPYDTIRYGID